MQIHGDRSTITQTKFKEKSPNVAYNYLDIEHRAVGTMHHLFDNRSQTVSYSDKIIK